MSGRVVVGGNGSVNEDKFSISIAAPFAGNGSVTLNARPNYRPSVSSKNGVTHNADAAALVGLSEISDYDITISKPCELLGQACDVELSMQNCMSKQANAMTISTTHEKIGDVTVSLARKGAKVGCETAAADRASVRVNLPMKDLISNDDVTASLEYDIPSQNATAKIGYTSGDVRLGVKSTLNTKSNDMTHKATVNYSGIDGVGIELDCNQDVAGGVSITKDKYELRVPFSKDGGVNPDAVQLRMKWSHAL
jgi:hypothetical protein